MPAKGFRKSTRTLEATSFCNNEKGVTRGFEHALRPFDSVITQTIPKRSTQEVPENPGNVGRRDIELLTQIRSTQSGIGEMSLQIFFNLAHNLATVRIASTEQFMDGRHQVALAYGFEEDVPGAVLHRTYRLLEAAGLRQDDEVGAYDFMLDCAHYFQAVEIRQVHVQNGDVNERGADSPQCFATVPGCPYAPRLRLKPDHLPEAATDAPVVVRDDKPDSRDRLEMRSILVRYV